MQIKKTEKGKNIFFRTSITSLGKDMFKTVGLVLINYIKASKLHDYFYIFENDCLVNK